MDDIRTIVRLKDDLPKLASAHDPQVAMMAFEEIVLKPQRFAIWKPDGAHDQMVKDALAHAIAEKMMYDVDVSRDQRDGRVMAMASTTVYMKPDNIEMNSTLRTLKDDNHALTMKNIELRDDVAKKLDMIVSLQRVSTEAISNWELYSDLYMDSLKRMSSKAFLFKQLMFISWKQTKAWVVNLSRYIPLRG